MKCLYAMPTGASEAAKTLAKRYAEALSSMSDEVIELGDDLRGYAENHCAAVLKLDDEDWALATEGLSQSSNELAGELFWSPAAAQRVRRALDETSELAIRRTISAWLGTQAGRERGVILLVA